MEIIYQLGGHLMKLKELSYGDLFCYPDSDNVFLLTRPNLEGKPEVVDIKDGIRYRYDADLDIIKLKGKVEVQPTTY